VTDRDDERPLRDAFTRLREDEARRAPKLAQLLARARADEERAPRFAWLRVALPLAGASAAAFAVWISSSTPVRDSAVIASADPQQLELEALRTTPGPIALGSLRSPTDALLAPPIGALSGGFSRSLIPAPPLKPPPSDQHSLGRPLWRTPT
jgi:hypothetical protein